MKKFLFIITLSLVLFSCKKDDDNSSVNFSTGIFKSNDWELSVCPKYSDPSMSILNKCTTQSKMVNQLEISKNSSGNYLLVGVGFDRPQIMIFNGNNFIINDYVNPTSNAVNKASGSFSGNTVKINITMTMTGTGFVSTSTGTGTFTK